MVSLSSYSKILAIAALLVVCSLSSCSSSSDPKKDEIIIRDAVYPNDVTERLQLDEDYRRAQEATKWGKGEAKPYKDRYKTEQSPFPYQGNVK